MYLIVRTKDRLKETLKQFSLYKLEAEVLSISSLEYNKFVIPKEAEGLVVTSPNAVITIPETKLPLFCVGARTAQEAIDAGLRVVHTGEKDAQLLAENIVKRFPKEVLLHVCGDQVDAGWYGFLEKRGFKVIPQKVYHTVYTDKISEDVLTGLRENKYKNILFFSTKGAKHFAELAQEYKLDCSKFKAVALSENVAQPLEGFAEVKVVDKPSLPSMIQFLKTQK